MNKLPKLQSGFLSFDIPGLKKKNYTNDPFIDIVLDKDHLKAKNFYYYHEVIDTLYTNFLKNPDLIKEFDFREQILKAAKDAFGCKYLQQWLALQDVSDKITASHQSFIIETLGYILSGERKLTVNQWVRLIEVSEKAKIKTINLNSYIKDNFIDQGTVNYISNTSLRNCLVTWTSQQNGFVDLLISLYVIFGDRPYVTDIVNRNPM